MLGFAYEADGQYDRAVAAFRAGFDMETHATPLAALGHAYASARMRRKAHAVLNELRALSRTQFVSQYFFALVHAGLGDVDEALNCLERAHREGCDWLLHAGVEPRWDNLRRTGRFQKLLTKLSLPDLAAR